MSGGKQHLSTGDVHPAGMLCLTCNGRYYLDFNKFWLWAASFFALVGLAKIGHLQMSHHYALQAYLFLCVCAIVLPSIRLSATPGPLEKSSVSMFYRLHLIIYLSLCGSGAFIAADIYSSLTPAKSSLIEIQGRVKEIGIRNGRFSFITLETPPNLEFLVYDRFDSPAAHLEPGTTVSLFVDKDPSITGDSYTVWEVRDGVKKVLLPYEDLRITRMYEVNKARVPYLGLFIVLLVGYIGTKYRLKRIGFAGEKSLKREDLQKPEEVITPHPGARRAEPELDEKFYSNPLSIFAKANRSTYNILAIIAIASLIAALLSIFMFFAITAFKVFTCVFISSVSIIALLKITSFFISIYHTNKTLFATSLVLIAGTISVYQFGSPYRLYEQITAPPPVTTTAKTIFTAHLNGPLSTEDNLLYCATFQKAWDMMRTQMIKEDIRLKDEPPSVRQLNQLALGNDDLSPDSYVAGAGAYSQDLVRRVNGEVQKKFGDQADENFRLPQASAGNRSIIAYGFLYKNLEFPIEFEKIPTPLSFQAASSITPVKAFGIELFSHENRLHEKLASQVSILDYRDDNDFILSLTSKSKDDEIILAKIKPGKTILDTYQAVAKRITSGKRSVIEEHESLKIPKINFDLSHRFSEFDGKPLLNNDWEKWYIAAATQAIRFKLNEKGAVLKSKAFILGRMKGEAPVGRSKPRMYIFDKPYLICLKQKAGKQPYLALWVNNPELMRTK
ncbi:hypothetical protein [Geomonas subterranea]|uniref:hypothetical protein n=1 Tax=Geomonas subterranea TaxID=2847989 RepID=UPI001CD2E14D|nr:hypothetical protein [Geomonas fuzhouensis]